MEGALIVIALLIVRIGVPAAVLLMIGEALKRRDAIKGNLRGA